MARPDIVKFFGHHGPLAKHLKGFSPRAAQQEMAHAVEKTLKQYGLLVCEAGTGIGKTFAYLIPAILSHKRVIVSTATRALQDQLFHRDLPLLRKTLDFPVKSALLKGRSNYFCFYRFNLACQDNTLSYVDKKQIEWLKRWQEHTQDGDLAGSGLPEDTPLRFKMISTNENCLHYACQDFERCFVRKARELAQEADLVVVNHHLFCADLVLEEDGFGNILPGANAVILDEAHQFFEIASQFFSVTLGSYPLMNLYSDLYDEYSHARKSLAALGAASSALEEAVQMIRAACGLANRRGKWQELSGQQDFLAALDCLRKALTKIIITLNAIEHPDRSIGQHIERTQLFLNRLEMLISPPPGWQESIRWFETSSRHHVHFSLTPMDVASLFRPHLNGEKRAWIFTSATLTVGNSFHHFVYQLGLENATTMRLDSPFDYQRNALLYLPTSLPDPNHISYSKALVETAIPILQVTQGRAFLLFTSHRALQEAAHHLAARISFPIFKQGDMPRHDLLQQFEASGCGVLLGTASFWEGVDVRGSALSCVMIDKLPFATPGDPLLQTRIEIMRQRGENPFMDYQLPQAVITLRQGVGRLIRDISDRGLLVLCDPRLHHKSYGKIFLESLPPFRRTYAFEDIPHFFDSKG